MDRQKFYPWMRRWEGSKGVLVCSNHLSRWELVFSTSLQTSYCWLVEQLSDLPEELISLTSYYLSLRRGVKQGRITNECDELHSHPKAFLMCLVTSHLFLVISVLLPCTPSTHLSAHRIRRGQEWHTGCLSATVFLPLLSSLRPFRLLCCDSLGWMHRLLENREKAVGACQICAAGVWEGKPKPSLKSSPQPSLMGAVWAAIPTWAVWGISSWAEAGTCTLVTGLSPQEDGSTIHMPQIPWALNTHWRSGHGDQTVKKGESLYLCPNIHREQSRVPRMCQCKNREDTEGLSTWCSRHRCLSQNQPQQLRPEGS